MEKYKNIIECKRTDAISSKCKQKTWNEICNEFNAKCISPEHRPADKLKLLWDNLKRSARKHLSTLRQETFKTGGGRNPVKEDLLCLQVKEILGSAIDPLDNPFDDDGLAGSFAKELDHLEVDAVHRNEESIEIIFINDEEPTLDKTMNDDDDWSEWNPSLLRKDRSPLLQIPSCVNTPKGSEHDHLDKIVRKRLSYKPYSRRRSNKPSSLKNFGAMIQAKVDYLEFFKKEASEKNEKQIMKNTLLEQELRIQLFRKQIENHDCLKGKTRNPVLPS
ncbi:uncharacterized protein LOC117172801 isoform X2 [Belonocnema kinseyi]|uniref:uncharacterized protein LOC117172801 isoform X2 n=1 Tax=Belonocnema kinseyi TaxID=2817044 RepID=UPI00143D680A|nr:uncharacterized protein LOC117172801 isoform X2 [Belonocnema kinseyi]